MNKILLYVQFLASFIIAQSISMWGQFYTLKYPDLSMLKALAMALPFAWLDWFFMTIAVNLGHKYKLVTETQDTFLLIITQFTVILLMNKFFLKQPLNHFIGFNIDEILITSYFITNLYMPSSYACICNRFR